MRELEIPTAKDLWRRKIWGWKADKKNSLAGRIWIMVGTDLEEPLILSLRREQTPPLEK